MNSANYYDRKCIELAESLENSRLVYLDVKFWVKLREVDLGRNKNDLDRSLLHVIESGIAAGECTCIMSDAVLIEVLKQSDQSTFAATLKLIDRLTNGLTLVTHSHRAMLEFAFLMAVVSGGRFLGVNSISKLVWTKSAFILGLPHEFEALDLQPDFVAKETIDKLWASNFEEQMRVIGVDRMMRAPRIPDISAFLNDGKVQYASENKSFDQLYKSELAGVLDIYEEAIQDASLMIAQDAGFDITELTDEEVREGVKKIQNVSFNGLRLKKLKQQLPTAHIHTCLHAWFRWDTNRRFKKNDQDDFEHAMAALPYSDIFLTEKDLKNTLTTKKMDLAGEYNCTVVSNTQDALAVLKNAQS